METISYKVDGLDCPEEVKILRDVVGKAEGVSSLEFHILQAKMRVTYDPTVIDSEKIRQLVHTTGMRATLWEKRGDKPPSSFWNRHSRALFTALSALFLVLGMATHFYYHPNLWDMIGAVSEEYRLPFLTKCFYFLSICLGVFFVLPKALYSLRRLRPDMNLLMVLAILGAIGIQEWFEGATVAFLFSLALLLEQWSVSKARRSIESLLQLAPSLASELDLSTRKLTEKRVEEVEVGAVLLVRPGEKIPLDGVVTGGSSSIEEAPITGESIPVLKEIGDEVFAGTLNEEGALEIQVTKKADETTLARIIQLVQEARGKRSKSEQWVEQFARFYTPLMLLFSILVMTIPPLLLGAAWFDWIYRGLVLLVIACPCALVISTPVCIVSGLTAAARQGVLIKGGMFLEEVGKLRAFALDKTGTLTYGHPEVQKVVPLNDHTEMELMERAVALEMPSEHPLARAVLRKGSEMGIEEAHAENFRTFRGKGAEGVYKEKLFWIGSHRFMHERGNETDEIHQKALELEDAGHTIIAIGTENHVCGLIGVADAPRAWVRETLVSLKKVGIEKIVMLTGDNEATAKALAELSGVDEYRAELLPEEKVAAVTELVREWGKVGMVGDGVNDAPAMAAATIGFAMGGMGTDTAIETADITLMADDLSRLPWLIRYSRRVLGLLKQNILFALGVKAIFITLALFDLATLWMAIGADTGATLLVVANALRLLRVRG
ncbi:MAG: putative cadmium-transporting ATPase [Chlamydiae bacterium]|nr:putative cadmium-transporting ATPase [Chlamydiota bacterium]